MFDGTPADLLGLRRVGTWSCLDRDMEALELVQVIPRCAHLNDDSITSTRKAKKYSGCPGRSRVESRESVWHYFASSLAKPEKCVPS